MKFATLLAEPERFVFDLPAVCDLFTMHHWRVYSDETRSVKSRDSRFATAGANEGDSRPMNPAQIYETTIFNRDRAEGVCISVVPLRSLQEPEIPSIESFGEFLVIPGVVIRPVEAWSLPFLIDQVTGNQRAFGAPFPDHPFDWPLRLRPNDQRWASPFAEHVSFAPVIPFESSPLQGNSLAGLVTSAGGLVGAYMTHDPLLIITVPGGIIVCRAALHIGDGIGIAAKTLILRLVGIEDDAKAETRDAEE